MAFRYAPLPKTFFERNRKNFTARMAPGTAAVFFSADRVTVNADAHYRFVQDTNFYYLSGLDQEDCILFLFPDAPKEEMREVLFIKPTSDTIKVWEGWKYTKEEATEASGIATIKYLTDFEGFFNGLVQRFGGVYIDVNEHARNHYTTQHHAHRFADEFRRRFPAHALHRAYPILNYLRMFKAPEEMVQLREACRLTALAFDRICDFIAPGKMEFEVEAEIIHTFINGRAYGHAYEPIIAGGKNACILHYNQNHCVLNDGDLLLMDFGAKYAHYSADLTRTVPVNGRFTDRQRQVYDAVLRVHQDSIQRLRAGRQYQEYLEEAQRQMQDELLALGLQTQKDVDEAPKDWPAYKKYFPHGLGHHLGLDTHDLGDYFMEIQPGMVFTIEPGIYINDEGLGIRIENDILVTETGVEDLMANIPVTADAIEARMRR